MSDHGTNGASGSDPGSGARSHAARDPEQIAEEWGGRIGRWILRAAARAEEEAEDIWADAQALRRDL